MKYSLATDTGKMRTGNEDFLFASDKPTGPLPNLFIVADGMGGHNAGEVASELAVSTLVDSLRNTDIKDPVYALKEAIERANEKVLFLSRSEPGKSGMGTTLVACTVFEERILISSVGDSRLYIKDDSGFSQITKDHTVVGEMLRMGSISKSLAKSHPKRHMLTRAVGVMEHVEIDFFDTQRRDGMKILLCTDGLCNMIEDSRLDELISGDADPVTKAGLLINEANANGGEDNITLVLVEV